MTSACSDLASVPARGIASDSDMDAKSVINKLVPFTADGCPTFPYSIEYPNQDKWALCCIQHNVAYWKGGSSDDRQDADKQLRACIIEQGDANAAGLVYVGVRQRDMDLITLTRRWGYGWKINRGYAPLSIDERAQVTQLEKEIPTDYRTVKLAPRAKNLLSSRDTLTGNFCVDGVLTFIQEQLHRSVIPMRVQHELTPVQGGFEETVKINDQNFEKPYVFTFFTNNKNACTLPASKWPAGTRLKIQSADY